MTDQNFDSRRRRHDHSQRPERPFGHGDFYRAVFFRPGVGRRFQRWMIRPFSNQ